MDKTKRMITISLLSVLTIFLIVCILKQSREKFENTKIYKYGEHPIKPIKLTKREYIKLMESKRPNLDRFPGTGTLSWENDTVLKDKRLMEVMNILSYTTY